MTAQDASNGNTTPVHYWPHPGTKQPTPGEVYHHFKTTNDDLYVVTDVVTTVGAVMMSPMIYYTKLGGGSQVYHRTMNDFLALVEDTPGTLVPRFVRVEMKPVSFVAKACASVGADDVDISSQVEVIARKGRVIKIDDDNAAGYVELTDNSVVKIDMSKFGEMPLLRWGKPVTVLFLKDGSVHEVMSGHAPEPNQSTPPTQAASTPVKAHPRGPFKGVVESFDRTNCWGTVRVTIDTADFKAEKLMPFCSTSFVSKPSRSPFPHGGDNVLVTFTEDGKVLTMFLV